MKAKLKIGIATGTLCLFLAVPVCYAENVGQMLESFGDSIGQGLENLGQQLNRANNSFLNSVDGRNAASYEDQMRQYRMLEEARVRELSEASGVSPDHIRKLRSDGMTWEQIASQYGINLDSLPQPQVQGLPSENLAN